MKILIFTKEYNHEKVGKSGGTGVFYRNLVQQLRSRNHDVVVFGSSRKPVNFLEDGVQHHFVQHYFKKNKTAELCRSVFGKIKFLHPFQTRLYHNENKYLVDELAKILKKNDLKIDIIETHDWDGISLNLPQLKIPYVVRYHGSWTILKNLFGYKNVPQGKLDCEKKAAQISKNNISISRFSEAINREIFGIQNPVLIYNGVDLDFFKTKEDDKIIPKSLFFLGNVSAEKGADVALEAFYKIKKTFPEVTMHFIGSANGYEKKIDKRYKKDIYFYGRKNSEEVKTLISKAEIVLFPSKGENFSLSLLEVMAMKKAVICSSIPSFLEIIIDNENGMIAENATEFGHKATELFKNADTRKKLETNARKLIEDRFGIEKMTEETIKFYERTQR